MQPLHIVWFKRDLRVEDHAALSTALNRGAILALYCWEPAMWEAEDASMSQQVFVGECLKSLRLALQHLGVTLHISSMGIVETLNVISKQQPIAEIHSHEETGNLTSYAIDKSVAKWCKTYHVKWYEYPQNGVVRALKNRDDWHANWESHMRASLITTSPSSFKHPVIALPKPPVTRASGQDKPQRQLGGREAALTTLSSFLNYRSGSYRGGISSPIKAAEASSRLSSYLAWGCLSLREVVQATRTTVTQQRAKGMDAKHPLILGLRSFERRLHWHCHFIQKLESEPTLEIAHMHSAHVGIRDELLSDTASQRRLAAWCNGQTGWPMVDACLAMLKQQGWINFRMRAMLMSSASYLLWLHWRETGLHLAREFVDYEPGIHWPQVQMQSGSTGINTLRIYNPVKQAQDQDPRGQFVRKWIPALRRVPDAWIFEPALMPPQLQLKYGCVIEKDYPMPIVDIRQAIQQAKSQIAFARKEHQHKYETQNVLHKHGSRTFNNKPSSAKKRSVNNKPQPPTQIALF